MPLRPCIELVDGVPCGVPSTGTRCPKHERPRADADNRRRNAKTVAHGVKRAHFQRLREQRLEMTGGFCELQVDRGCTVLATTVHLREELRGDHGRATIDDVRAACRHCHGVTDGKRSRR
jgi:hypothetical protein